MVFNGDLVYSSTIDHIYEAPSFFEASKGGIRKD